MWTTRQDCVEADLWRVRAVLCGDGCSNAAPARALVVKAGSAGRRLRSSWSQCCEPTKRQGVGKGASNGAAAGLQVRLIWVVGAELCVATKMACSGWP